MSFEKKYPFFTSGNSVLSFNNYLVEGENIFLSTGGNAIVNFGNYIYCDTKV